MLCKSPVYFLKGKSSCVLFGGHWVLHRNTCRTLFLGPTSRVITYIPVTSRCDALQKTNPFNFGIAHFYSNEASPSRTLKTLHDIIETNTKDKRYSLKRQMVDELNDYMEDLSTKKDISTEEWSKLKEMLLNTPQFNATEKNVETVTLKLMNRFHIFRFAKLYYNHLKSLSVNINPATLSMYVRYMYSFKEQCTAEDFLDAEEICSKLIEASPILPLTTGENVICGLSITKNWRKSLEILKDMKQHELSRKCYFAVAEACFWNKDYENGWQIVDDIGRKNWQLDERLTNTILIASIDKHDAILRLLKFYGKYYDRPFLDCAQNILSCAKKLSKGKIKPAFTKIDNRGICQNCKRKLINNSITEEEFEKLRKSFLNPVLIGRDIFLKSSPEELNSFQRVLKKFTPFDFVLDGLNIAFSASTAKCKEKPLLARNLLSVVDFLVNQKKKVLVIGRKHMLTWPKPIIQQINKKSYFFLAEDITQDDTFLLYATLYSGIHTNFVSRDLMRGHRYLLDDPDLESIFWRWQYQRQYLVVSIHRNGNVEFQTPVPYRQDAHSLEDDRLWHVPCYDEVQPNTPGYEKMSNKTWLCLPLTR